MTRLARLLRTALIATALVLALPALDWIAGAVGGVL